MEGVEEVEEVEEAFKQRPGLRLLALLGAPPASAVEVGEGVVSPPLGDHAARDNGNLSVSAASASCTSSLAASSLAAIHTERKPAADCVLSFSVASAAFGRFQPWYRPYMFNVLISAFEL